MLALAALCALGGGKLFQIAWSGWREGEVSSPTPTSPAAILSRRESSGILDRTRALLPRRVNRLARGVRLVHHAHSDLSIISDSLVPGEPATPPSPASHASALCRFGVFEVNLGTRQILKAGREIHLQEQPLRLLMLLLERPGELRTREELQRRLWPNDTFVEFDDGLNTAIQKIRQVLGDEARNPRFVETVPRQGYRFIAPARLEPAVAAAAVETPPLSEPPVVNAATIGWRLPALLAALAGLALGWFITAARVAAPPSGAPLMRLAVTPPPGVLLRQGIRGGSAISPDGQSIVFAGSQDGQHQLWLRRLDSLEAKPLPGTGDGALPFWSPDGRSIGFQAFGKIRRIEAAGGPPQDLATATRPTRGTWTESGEILFATGTGGPIMSVPAGGGEARVAVQGQGGGALWPVAVAGSNRFLFFDQSNRQVRLAALPAPAAPPAVLMPSQANALYAPAYAGHPAALLWLKDTTLVAQQFDASSAKLAPETKAIASDLALADRTWFADATVSRNGVLAYARAGGEQGRLAWVRRDGSVIRHLETQDFPRSVRLSADGRRALVERGRPRTLWMIDFERDVQTRVTFDQQDWSGWPVWSPDGSQIAFSGEWRGRVGLFVRNARDGQPAVALAAGSNRRDDYLYDWSPDGRCLIYTEINPETKLDLWVQPLHGDRQPRAFLSTRFNEDSPQFSPDGLWVAYVSDESGRNEVYVTAFPDAKGKWQISTGGGAMPRWPKSGELFFESAAGQMMAARTRAAAGRFEWSAPKPLFPKPMAGRNYDVAPAGDRLLITTPAEGRAHNELTVIVNWHAALAR